MITTEQLIDNINQRIDELIKSEKEVSTRIGLREAKHMVTLSWLEYINENLCVSPKKFNDIVERSIKDGYNNAKDALGL